MLTTISKFNYLLTLLLKVKTQNFLSTLQKLSNNYDLNCSLSFRKFCLFLHLNSSVGFLP